MDSFSNSLRNILLGFLDPNYNINNQMDNFVAHNSILNTNYEENNINSINDRYIIRNDVSQLISQLPIIILEEQFIIEKEPFCSICLEKLEIDNTVIQLPCQHLFCFGKHEDTCQGIIPWIKQNKTCPVCRKTVYFK